MDLRLPYLDDGDVRLYAGDCVEVMREMDAESVDALVCDPPYGLGFMGKEWDRPWAVSASNDVGYAGRDDLKLPSHRDNRNANCRGCGGRQRGAKRCRCDTPQWDRDPKDDMRAFQSWCETWATEALRVLKPGGHLLAFGGTRTFHRLTCAVEDAGFEVRDCLSWLYGSGFPKSLDVSKAIDRAAGVERDVVGPYLRPGDGNPYALDAPEQAGGNGSSFATGQRCPIITAPATPDAARWQGWGTALKPAWEPVVVARKPIAERTVAKQVLSTGTGALNVDGCRIDTGREVVTAGLSDPANRRGEVGRAWQAPSSANRNRAAQLASLERANRLGRWPANLVIDERAAELLDEAVGELRGNKTGVFGKQRVDQPSDTAAPFAVRKAGDGIFGYGDTGGPSRFFYTAKVSREERDGSRHPTVKPLALMRWLVRLVTPPGGVVLDPFAGSGTTLRAARDEGFRAVGIEREEEYLVDAARRLRQLSLFGDAA